MEKVCCRLDRMWWKFTGMQKSTSGCAVAINGNVVMCFSRTQKVVATSSAESDFYAAAGSLQEGIFIQRFWNFLQHHVEDEGALTRDEASSSTRSQLVLRCDSSACRGIMRKVGTGKAKHIAISVLWTQELAKQRRVRITAVRTLDVFTKALPVKRIHMLMGVMHFFWNESGEQVGFDELMEEIYKQDRKMSFKEAKVLLVLTNVPGVDASEQPVPEIAEQSSTWCVAISLACTLCIDVH